MKRKITVAVIIAVLFWITGFSYIANAKQSKVILENTEYAASETPYYVAVLEVMSDYASDQTGGQGLITPKREITQQMIEKGYAVPMSNPNFTDGAINASDASAVQNIVNYGKESEILKSVLSDIAKATKLNESDLEFEVLKGSIIEDDGRNKPEEIRTRYRLNVKTPNGEVYTWCIANSGEFLNNWYMVKTVENKGIVEFDTELSYVAKIGESDVGGSMVDGYFVPNYDKNNPEKDADVTAIITSKTKSNIVKIDGVELTVDGKPNSKGWYYVNPEDKTVIAKLYKFDTYDNLEYHGMVSERDLEVTSEDGLVEKESVNIKWQFRIIDVNKNPSEVDEKTEKVTVTVTTNLPIDKEKLPAGYEFTDDDEGKSQHRIYKDYYKKDGDVDEDIIVTAHGRSDTDKTKAEIKWKEEKKSPVIPQAGSNTFTMVTVGIVVAISCGIIAKRKMKNN